MNEWLIMVDERVSNGSILKYTYITKNIAFLCSCIHTINSLLSSSLFLSLVQQYLLFIKYCVHVELLCLHILLTISCFFINTKIVTMEEDLFSKGTNSVSENNRSFTLRAAEKGKFPRRKRVSSFT